MKRSRNYYLKRLSNLVERHRSNQSLALEGLSEATQSGLINVFSEYLYSTWMDLGDTAFNRQGYRSSTDFIFEHLQQRK
jgi:hypothetical protein